MGYVTLVTVDVKVLPGLLNSCKAQFGSAQFENPGGLEVRGCLTLALVIRSLRLGGLLYASIGGSGKMSLFLGSTSKVLLYLSIRDFGKSIKFG